MILTKININIIKLLLNTQKMWISLIYGYLNCQKYQAFKFNKVLVLFIEFFIEF